MSLDDDDDDDENGDYDKDKARDVSDDAEKQRRKWKGWSCLSILRW